ncbi:MAG TPA: AAA family ATPase [Pirellulaceae bacterium]|nr:AAA family ATPase [Pirellulaceae bacterium]
MPTTVQPTRIMVAGDDDAHLRHALTLLGQQSHTVPAGLVVRLAMTADRASRASPDLLLVDLTGDVDLALDAIRQARQSCDAYIVASGPADDPRLILKCLHDGADEYLDASILAEELACALTRFETKSRTRLAKESPGKVIGVIGVSGGTGASTIAANVAGLLARSYKVCGLVDLRLQSGDLAALLSLKPQHTLADFCGNVERLDRSMYDQMFTKHPSGIELLAAPWDIRQARLVTPQYLRLLLAMGRAKYPYLIVDLDNRLDDLQMEGLWQSDLILLVTRLDYVAIRNCRRLLDRLHEMGLESSRVQVVANRYGQPRELSRDQAEAALGVGIDSFVVDDPRRVNRSANEGKLVAMQSSWSTISHNLSALASSVNGKHK